MLFLTPYVISEKIQHNGYLLKTKAFIASAGVHGAVFALALYISMHDPLPASEEEKAVVISLAEYTPSKSASKESPHPKRSQSRPIAPRPKTHAPATEKLRKQTPAPTPQAIPPLSSPVLPEASSPQPSLMRSTVAPSDPTPITNDSDHKSIANNSPYAAPSQNAHELPEPSVSRDEINGATLGRIRAMIENALTYPATARRLRLEGTAVVSFILRPNGCVEKAQIVTTSGSTLLDAKALQTVLGLSGEYPALTKTAFLNIPITFTLTRH